MANLGDTGHSAGIQRRAIHDGGIQLIASGCGEDRATTGIEQGIVFQAVDHCHNRVERGSTLIQDSLAAIQRGLHGCPVRRVGFRGHRAPLDHARPAMDDERPFSRLIGQGNRGREKGGTSRRKDLAQHDDNSPKSWSKDFPVRLPCASPRRCPRSGPAQLSDRMRTRERARRPCGSIAVTE